jgi:GR25 family glycosyltransferase involved in LPS biosynthesis
MLQIDHIYVITIDHSEENYSSIIQRLQDCKFPFDAGFTIFPGMDGKNVIGDIQNLDNFGYRLYPDWVISENKDYYDEKWYGREMTLGEIGCVVSHIQVWEDAYDNDYENILILEDDFIIRGEQRRWDIFEELGNYDFDLVIFDPSHIVYGYNTNNNVNLKHFTEPGYCYNSHAYTLTQAGVVKIVEENLETLKENLVPVDEFLPSLFAHHPRRDMRCLFERNLKALKPKDKLKDFFFKQTRYANKGSTTS